eukprot:3937948-Rhodomonas_salina.1
MVRAGRAAAALQVPVHHDQVRRAEAQRRARWAVRERGRKRREWRGEWGAEVGSGGEQGRALRAAAAVHRAALGARRLDAPPRRPALLSRPRPPALPLPPPPRRARHRPPVLSLRRQVRPALCSFPRSALSGAEVARRGASDYVETLHFWLSLALLTRSLLLLLLFLLNPSSVSPATLACVPTPPPCPACYSHTVCWYQELSALTMGKRAAVARAVAGAHDSSSSGADRGAVVGVGAAGSAGQPPLMRTPLPAMHGTLTRARAAAERGLGGVCARVGRGAPRRARAEAPRARLQALRALQVHPPHCEARREVLGVLMRGRAESCGRLCSAWCSATRRASTKARRRRSTASPRRRCACRASTSSTSSP